MNHTDEGNFSIDILLSQVNAVFVKSTIKTNHQQMGLGCIFWIQNVVENIYGVDNLFLYLVGAIA